METWLFKNYPEEFCQIDKENVVCLRKDVHFENSKALLGDYLWFLDISGNFRVNGITDLKLQKRKGDVPHFCETPNNMYF